MLISFNSYVFTAAGSAQFSRSSRFEPDARIARPQRELVTWKVKEMFLESSFADNQARYTDLRAALAAGEGILTITDESERVLFNDRVRVAGNDLPEQWGEYTTEVNVEMAALPKPVAQANSDASFTPSGSDTAVALPNVTNWKESVHTERYAAEVVPNRRVTMVHISCSGRFTADPATNDAARRAAVLAMKNAIETCNDSPDGTLAYASMSSVVMIDSAEVEVGDGTAYCEWSIMASYRRFPDGDYSEMEFDVATNDNIEQAERITNVTGKIRANSQDAATSSAAALMATFAETGRIQTVNDQSAKQVQGADGAAFIELTFTFTWRETLSPVAWTLTLSTKADAKSNGQILTAAGTCRSGDSGAALAQAGTLGVVSGQGVLMGSTIEYHSRGLDTAEQGFEVTFSYEYLSRAGRVYAEVSNDNTDESFGDMGQVISGFVVANTQNAVIALARSFKLGDGFILKSAKENVTTSNAGTGTTDDATFDAGNASLQVLKCEFSYSYYAAHVDGSAKYGVATVNDVKTMIQSVTYSGTAWASTEAAANALINTIIGTPAGQLTKSDRRADSEERDSVTGFLAVTFTDIYEGPFTSDAGSGVLEAEWGIECVLSVEQAIVTPIPYGTPVVQTDTGYNPGSVTVTGFAMGASEAAVKAWGRATRAIVQQSGYYEKPPREKTGFTFYFNAMSDYATDQTRLIRFDFTYSADLALLLEGL